MARPFDGIIKDNEGFVHIDTLTGKVLFRVIDGPSGKVIHIRLKPNCLQVKRRNDPDYYVPWDEFKSVIEDA